MECSADKRADTVASGQRVGCVNRLAVELDFAFVGHIHAGQDLAEGAFACAVLADQRMTTAALLDFEAHP